MQQEKERIFFWQEGEFLSKDVRYSKSHGQPRRVLDSRDSEIGKIGEEKEYKKNEGYSS